jgi:hypothetical protein
MTRRLKGRFAFRFRFSGFHDSAFHEPLRETEGEVPN